ncbi:MAG: hypothetical protein NTX50_10645 [Candidatus Sumerlaeota bacterium]|nr:hypothetical protein [Candidatus Sumerlaeota bacterium]
MRIIHFLLVLTCLAPSFCIAAPQKEDWVFITNGKVRLGVDRTRGACVGHFSEATSGGRNLLNHADPGRFLQQSYYGDSDGSLWNKKEWRYNPVQGGEWRGTPAKVLDFRSDGKSLYVKILPKHWASGADCPEMTMEEWIALEDDVARIHFKMTYSGPDHRGKRQQEMPAFFCDYDLPWLVYYKGKAPWTGDAVTKTDPPENNAGDKITENWAAFVDGRDWGVGLYVPGTDSMTYYRKRANGKSGEKGAACSYFAPLRTFTLTKGLTVEYDVFMTIGTTEQIRERFRRLKDKI